MNIRDDIGGIAFDLDGTLIDSAPDIAFALNQALTQAGLTGFDVARVRAWVGDGPDVLIDRALKALGCAGADDTLRAELRRGFDAATLAAPLHHGRVCDGVAALIEQLRNVVPMVVVRTILQREPIHVGRRSEWKVTVMGKGNAVIRVVDGEIEIELEGSTRTLDPSKVEADGECVRIAVDGDELVAMPLGKPETPTGRRHQSLILAKQLRLAKSLH